MFDRLKQLHHNEQGSLSLTSMFALIVLVMLLGMVINSGRQVHRKIQMQNTADAAAWSGGVVMARGMNSLAFSNHLLCDVFALTAYLREGRAGRAEVLTIEIMANWERVSPEFVGSEFPKFDILGQAMVEHVPLERESISTWSNWTAASSELMLPVFESILQERSIPNYQRAVAYSTPRLAQYAANEIARRHGEAWPTREEAFASIWRTSTDGNEVDPIDGNYNDFDLAMPVADPVDQAGMLTQAEVELYRERAIDERFRYSHTYLVHWNNDLLRIFDNYGKMSRFSNLWRIFTAGELEQLLNEEYPDDNLPFQIRHRTTDVANWNAHLHDDFMFVGVAYSSKYVDRMPIRDPSYDNDDQGYYAQTSSKSSAPRSNETGAREQLPGVFRNPVLADSQAYAQIMLFVPRRRLIRQRIRPPNCSTSPNAGGVPGQNLPLPDPREQPEENLEPYDEVTIQPRYLFPDKWDLMTQNWSVQLAPATTPSLPEILSNRPYTAPGTENIEVPDLTPLTSEDVQWLSLH